MTQVYGVIERTKLEGKEIKPEMGRDLIIKGNKRFFWGDENVQYLDCGGGYITMYLSKL